MNAQVDLAVPSAHAPPQSQRTRSFFSVHAADAMFGLPVDSVQTIFRLQSLTPVPLGPPTISGLVNLRGKIVPAVGLARRLDLPQDEDAPAPRFAVAVESRGETFALLVDSVGDAMECSADELVESPRHVDACRARATAAYYRVQGGILPVLDIDALFDLAPTGASTPNRFTPRPSGAVT